MFQIRRYKRHIACFLGLIVLFTITGFFIAPSVLKAVLVKKLSAVLSRPVSIGKIYVNPYTLGVKIRNVRIGERTGTGTFFALTELKGRLGFANIGGTAALHDLSLTEPYVNIVRNDDGSYNFSDLLAMKQEPPAGQKKKDDQGLTFSLRDIAIVNGSADFWDGPVKKKHTIRELNLSIPHLSNHEKNKNKDVEPTLSLKLNNDPYSIRGRTKPFADSLETNFAIDLKRVNIPLYLAYLPGKTTIEVPSGFLDTQMQLSYRQYQDKTPSLSLAGNVTISQLVIHDDTKKPVVNCPALTVKINAIEPFTGKVHFAAIGVESPEIFISRDKNAIMNIARLFPETGETKKDKKTAGDAQTKSAGSGDRTPLDFTIDSLRLTSGKILFDDFSLSKPSRLVLEDIELKGEKISLAKGSTGSFEAKMLLNKKGTVMAGGTLGIDPLVIVGKIDLKGIDIRPFEPYFSEKFRVSLTGGSFATEGSLSIKGGQEKGPGILYQGKAAIAGLNAVDKETADSLLSFKSLHVRDINLGINPTAITVKGVSLTDFYANIVIKPDKSINFQDIMVKETEQVKPNSNGQEKTKTKQEELKEDTIPVKIDIVTLQGGTIRFRDTSVNPAFATKLDHIGGRISGLSSKQNTTADIELRGTLETAPLEITGKINPLSKNLYVDLKASFKDMDLTPATPYSGKYAGYTLDKGKLSFDVQYLIENRTLDSKNTVFIDQLTFGQKVESSDATSLPVKLAVALLKDRKGQIKLDLPVNGSLDDPQFSVWKIVLKIIVNLLTKAATAPFALIGSMFGGGEDLDYIEFDFGKASLTDAGKKKVAVINKILVEKADLKMDIEGYVDPERDREGLKKYLVQKKIRTQKLKELIKKSSETIDVDEIEIDQKEYEKYVRLAYKAEKFPKPRNMIGFEKSLPVPEMEKLMLTNIKITGDDLHSLGQRRAKRVMEGILKMGQIDAGRLFIVDSKNLRPPKNEKLKESRVEFKLK